MPRQHPANGHASGPLTGRGGKRIVEAEWKIPAQRATLFGRRSRGGKEYRDRKHDAPPAAIQKQTTPARGPG